MAISTFTFSLVFDKFFRSLIFLFTITTVLLILMLTTHHWRPEYTITLVSVCRRVSVRSDPQAEEAVPWDPGKQEERYHLARGKHERRTGLYRQRPDGPVRQRYLCQISGYTREQVIGKDLIEFAGSPTFDSPNSFYRRLRKGTMSGRVRTQ